MDNGLRIVDNDGNELRYTVVSSDGWTIDHNGTVHGFHEDENGREEWTEQLTNSPIRHALAWWLWDEMDLTDQFAPAQKPEEDTLPPE